MIMKSHRSYGALYETTTGTRWDACARCCNVRAIPVQFPQCRLRGLLQYGHGRRSGFRRPVGGTARGHWLADDAFPPTADRHGRHLATRLYCATNAVVIRTTTRPRFFYPHFPTCAPQGRRARSVSW